MYFGESYIQQFQTLIGILQTVTTMATLTYLAVSNPYRYSTNPNESFPMIEADEIVSNPYRYSTNAFESFKILREGTGFKPL